MGKHEGMTNLKVMRARRNMTQEELAKKAGVTLTTISYYETGHRFPRGDTLKKLAEALDCEIKDIV